VPQKNIRLLAGKPLISYTIEVALESNHINRLIVSTDDEEIARVAEKYNAEVPFLRPASLAQDDTPDQPVFQHALGTLKEQNNYEPDIVLNLRPTTPLKTAHTIDKVVEKIRETKADIVRTMTLVESVHHPYWMYNLDENIKADAFLPNLSLDNYYQSQLLPNVYRINGVVDAYTKGTVIKGNMLANKNLYGLVISEEESIDIDLEYDFALCEYMMNNYYKINKIVKSN
jgi:N-acylneuraminate cytidylyltransferase/CMP-N,N'-diacetyllegionaminic acid synthase